MFLVVFRKRMRPGFDRAAYDADSEAMLALAREQPGYVSFKAYAADDGEGVSISEWADEATARAWRQLAEHRAAQARGRGDYYQEYTVFACDNPRTYSFSREDRA